MIIKVENVSRVYKKGENKIFALNDVSFEINKGEFVSIVGKSGSGKSTILNLLGGLDSSSSGNIFVDNHHLQKMNRKELSHYRKFTIGMVFQSFNLIKSQTAIENVKLALTFGGEARNKRSEKAAELLYNLGLEKRMQHKPSELSGGEAQRVAIARAMANNPKIILADEPTGNLDSNTSNDIIELLKKLNNEQGITIIMVTHDKETAYKISDKIIVLADGKILENN